MADIPVTVDRYLAAVGRRHWQPGALDCGVFMADWVRELTGRDPIADVRGSYVTERQFLRILRREGGFMASLERRLAWSGFAETLSPGAGDIAAVLAPYRHAGGEIRRRPTGAICIDREWRAVVTADQGLVVARHAALPALKVFARG